WLWVNRYQITQRNNRIMKTKEGKFKAVEYMRAKREELSRLHNETPKEYKKQLEEIRKKYPAKFALQKRNEA
ncbi:MAG: hypothetical protein ABJC12_14205, partial [Saprospiraceae bacterium]